MKIIINCSNIVIGGGIQVSISVINELKKFPENDYHIFLSPKVESQLKKELFSKNFFFYNFVVTPSNVLRRREVVKKLSLLEREIKPEVVFSVFGPSYWRPKSLHIAGFADGWCYTPGNLAYKKQGLKGKVLLGLRVRYKNYYLKKTSDYLLVETEIAKKNIAKYLKFSKKRIYVVGNTYSDVFAKELSIAKDLRDNMFHFLTLSSFYIHKNLEIINNVSEILKYKNIMNVRFYLTIREELYKKYFSHNKYVINLGPQKIENCPKLYKMSDAMFLPTLLETFSASYPEAMKMRRPILTSNLDFAHDVCQKAAMYFNPLDPHDIALKIEEFISNKDVRVKLVEEGMERLKLLETPETRASKYLDVFMKILKENDS